MPSPTTQKYITSLEEEVKDLKWQVEQLRRAIFGKKSERHVTAASEQLPLFQVEQGQIPSVPEEREAISYQRSKRKKKPY